MQFVYSEARASTLFQKQQTRIPRSLLLLLILAAAASGPSSGRAGSFSSTWCTDKTAKAWVNHVMCKSFLASQATTISSHPSCVQLLQPIDIIESTSWLLTEQIMG